MNGIFMKHSERIPWNFKDRSHYITHGDGSIFFHAFLGQHRCFLYESSTVIDDPTGEQSSKTLLNTMCWWLFRELHWPIREGNITIHKRGIRSQLTSVMEWQRCFWTLSYYDTHKNGFRVMFPWFLMFMVSIKWYPDIWDITDISHQQL